MDGVFVSSHPLIRHKLAQLRATETDSITFRQRLHELTLLVGYEACQDLELKPTTIETPMGTTQAEHITTRVGLVPIMRAGLGMVDAMLTLIPKAEVWHMGLYRDEDTLNPVAYYSKFHTNGPVQLALILDPMLATGGTAVETTRRLKEWGVPHVKFLGLIAAPEGIEAMRDAYPDVDIHTAAVDERLNDVGFIVPGLGDAGDRQFGTGD